MVKYLEKNNIGTVSTSLLHYLGKVTDLYHKMHTIFLQRNAKDILMLATFGKELQKEGVAMLEKSTGANAVILHYLITVTMFIRHQGGRLMVLAEEF